MSMVQAQLGLQLSIEEVLYCVVLPHEPSEAVPKSLHERTAAVVSILNALTHEGKIMGNPIQKDVKTRGPANLGRYE